MKALKKVPSLCDIQYSCVSVFESDIGGVKVRIEISCWFGVELVVKQGYFRTLLHGVSL